MSACVIVQLETVSNWQINFFIFFSFRSYLAQLVKLTNGAPQQVREKRSIWHILWHHIKRFLKCRNGATIKF